MQRQPPNPKRDSGRLAAKRYGGRLRRSGGLRGSHNRPRGESSYYSNYCYSSSLTNEQFWFFSDTSKSIMKSGVALGKKTHFLGPQNALEVIHSSRRYENVRLLRS